MTSLIVETFAVGPLGCNCSMLINSETNTCIIIDPGGDHEKILEKIKAKNLIVTKIIHTHAHFDHFLASAYLKKALKDVGLYLHPSDKPLWDHLEVQCQMFGVSYPFIKIPYDFDLKDNMDLSEMGIPLISLHTPGHTPGSCCFLIEPLDTVITGDTLFKSGIGRTDLWGGDSKLIMRSIKERLLTLPDHYKVIPGHGFSTLIKNEMNLLRE